MRQGFFSVENIRDLVTTAKIMGSIFLGVFIGLLEYWLFARIAVATKFAILAGLLIAGMLFASTEARHSCGLAMVALLAGSLVLGGMIRIDRIVYYRIFGVIGGLVCVGAFLAFLGWTVSQSESIPRPELDANHSDKLVCNAIPPEAKFTFVEKPTRKQWTYKVREQIWNRDGKKCYICHVDLKNFTGEFMDIDHVRPFSKGVGDSHENLRACCIRCNREKHDRDHPELYSK